MYLLFTLPLNGVLWIFLSFIFLFILFFKKEIDKFIRKLKINATEMNIWNKGLVVSIIYKKTWVEYNTKAQKLISPVES